jgi:hypothetical protein
MVCWCRGSKSSTGEIKRQHGKVLQLEEDKGTKVPTGRQGLLDASDIQTNKPSKKLSHWHLDLFTFEIGSEMVHTDFASLPVHGMPSPVFNVIKLTPAPTNLIAGWHILPTPPPEITEGEEEWVVEEILDSKVINRKLQYLVKWIEHNSWEPHDNVHASYLVLESLVKSGFSPSGALTGL